MQTNNRKNMQNKIKFSVITIVKGREAHLYNLLQGVKTSRLQPDEIRIVAIDEVPDLTAFKDLPIEISQISSKGANLPIAEARNIGAENAKFDHLIFLDVDCIPHPEFFDDMITQGLAHKTLIMGNPYYLESSIPQNFELSDLEELSAAHPARPEISELVEAGDYMLFWSLAFYIPKQLFKVLEGFDAQFTGYGAEDTDVAMKMRQIKSIYPLLLSPAKVYHQQHPVHSPPVHQVEAIVINARIFYEKWERWVMENWLEEFRKLGLIRWEADGSTIEILKQPDKDLIEQSYQPEAAYM